MVREPGRDAGLGSGGGWVKEGMSLAGGGLHLSMREGEGSRGLWEQLCRRNVSVIIMMFTIIIIAMIAELCSRWKRCMEGGMYEINK